MNASSILSCLSLSFLFPGVARSVSFIFNTSPRVSSPTHLVRISESVKTDPYNWLKILCCWPLFEIHVPKTVYAQSNVISLLDLFFLAVIFDIHIRYTQYWAQLLLDIFRLYVMVCRPLYYIYLRHKLEIIDIFCYEAKLPRQFCAGENVERHEARSQCPV